jgi:hypothetical protein
MVKRLLVGPLLVCLAFAPQSWGQSAGTDAFAQIKAKADKGDPEAQLALAWKYAATKFLRVRTPRPGSAL